LNYVTQLHVIEYYCSPLLLVIVCVC